MAKDFGRSANSLAHSLSPDARLCPSLFPGALAQSNLYAHPLPSHSGPVRPLSQPTSFSDADRSTTSALPIAALYYSTHNRARISRFALFKSARFLLEGASPFSLVQDLVVLLS